MAHDTSDYTSIQSTFFCCSGSIVIQLSHYNKRNSRGLVKNNPLRNEWTQHAAVVYVRLPALCARVELVNFSETGCLQKRELLFSALEYPVIWYRCNLAKCQTPKKKTANVLG